MPFLNLHAQKKKIELAFSEQNIFVGDDFVIEAKVTNIQSGIVPSFPELPGFKKTTVSVPYSSTMNRNGVVTGIIKYHQYYKAIKEGVFKVPVFTVKADGASATHGNFTIKVKGLPSGKGESYLLLETSKDEIFVGEPFKLSLSFIYKEKEYKFLRHANDYHEQIAMLKSKLVKPSFWVEEIKVSKDKEYVYTAKGERMIKEVLYQVVLVPQSSESITFDSLNLVMLKAQNTSKGFRWLSTVFSTSIQNMKVKSLPDHPLKGKVPVGVYRLREGIEKVNMLEAENTVYTFEVSGEGNLASLLDPYIVKTDSLLVFKEGDRLEYSNDTGKVAGQKVYQYNLVPDKPGSYELKNYIFFPYFNSVLEKYDTLKSTITLNVVKDSKRQENSKKDVKSNNGELGLSSRKELSKELKSIDEPEKQNFVIILLLLLLMAGLVYTLVKKRGE